MVNMFSEFRDSRATVTIIEFPYEQVKFSLVLAVANQFLGHCTVELRYSHNWDSLGAVTRTAAVL